MKNSADFQIEFLKELSFNRYGGTADEERAARLILQRVKDLGGEASEEEFDIQNYSVSKASLEILEPFYRKIEVSGVGRSGSTDGPIEAQLFYAEGGEEENFKGAKGKIVLINTLAKPVYKRLVESGALGFIVYSGKYHDDRGGTDLEKRMLRPALTDKLGAIPGLCLRTEDAILLLKEGAETVRFELAGKNETHTSRNVTAFIKGTGEGDKEFLFTAHYDSTPFGLGAWDNASGSANILEIYRHYLAHPPVNSMRFIWCGSEEQGLLGSRAYVAAHPDEIEKILVCFNFDMTGTVVGSNRLMVTGNGEIDHYIKFLSKEVGYITKYCDDVHHSDSAPFANAGVPAIGFMRDGQAGGHSRFDIPWPLSGEKLAECTDFAIALVDRLDSARSFPFDRKIEEGMAKKVKDYIEPED